MPLVMDVASPFISFAVEGILNKIISETHLVIGLEEKIQQLHSTLKSLHNLIEDASSKEVDSMAIRKWLEKLGDLAYRAEEIFDKIDYEDRRQKVEVHSHFHKVTNFISCSKNPIIFKAKIAHAIENINDDLVKHKQDSFVLGLIPILYSEPPRIEETDSYLDNSEVVFGREAEVSDLLNIIKTADSACRTLVIPIVGMGGLGKTTLARVLSNVVKENKIFDETFWVCVSNSFDSRVILSGMLESLSINAVKKENIEAILKFLREKLEDKSFFLVLDDVWNEDRSTWDNFISRLNKINKDKRICVIVTTRSYDVASITESDHIHCPGQLSDDQCWYIIKDKVFGKRVHDIPQGLKDVGKEIAKKCGGLPLLARVLGGMMRSIKTEDDWKSINESKELSLVKGNNEVLPILKLSFDRLPSSSLKQSFAYCAVFPPDSIIQKMRLIQLWMAEGYVQSDEKRNMSAEEVGEENFRILYVKSLFQEATKNKLGDVISCKMHDVIHELAVIVSGSQIWTSKLISRSDFSNIRHVSFTSDAEFLTRLGNPGCEKLHSLFTQVNIFEDASRSFKLMRVMDIHDSDTNDIPESSLRPKHLRYLDISGTRLNNLPKSVTKAYNLQTLRLVRCKFLKTPQQGILNLISLKHLILDTPDIVPSNIGKLTALETLPKFAVGRKKGLQIKELGSLEQLGGELVISSLENVRSKLEADEANIKEKSKLRHLEYRWSKNRGRFEDETVLDGLQPHSNLRELYIQHFMGQLSSWLSDHLVLKSLCRLQLDGCRNCSKLPTLGELPRLQVLKLVGMERVKHISIEFYTSRVDQTQTITFFPSLKELEIHDMRQLEEWILPKLEQGMTVFPCLEELNLVSCRRLTSIPLGPLKSLKNLELHSCEDLEDLGEESVEVVNTTSQSGLTSLVSLWLCRCSKLKSLPRGLQFSTSLTSVTLLYLNKLAVVPDYLGDLTSLVEFMIISCDAVTQLPARLQSIESLKVLQIVRCENLEIIPENLEDLRSLVNLRIEFCPKLSCVPNLPCYESLKRLGIGGLSTEIEELPNIRFTSIEALSIVGSKGSKAVPDLLRNFTSVTKLEISYFVDIEVLPDWLENLSSLIELYIRDCPNLKSLPENITCLTNLRWIIVERSPILAAKLYSDNEESSKIAHVPTVRINGSYFRRE